ncbi:hypothetical protein OESDEN_00049 [Oesophagostomum dentatum]|uniref:Transmembrane protein 135 N-terminal domain-containing protein n=1 Tax=Oesophagostomum dentatum TaxID=61180 RepID=A0A0B1TV17_OESDE|nr:hypothetical protein OESDEN_00049 [Oesophagostomum dentatum]
MPTLSKLAYNAGLPVLNANCYEVIHTWTPSCNQAILDTLIPDGILFCLKTYAPFYLITALVAKKGDVRKIDWQRYIKDVTRSTIFLACNLVLFIHFLCRFRSVIVSASETLFRQLSNHGYIPKVNNAEIIPFVIGMGLLAYLHNGKSLDSGTEKMLSYENIGLQSFLRNFTVGIGISSVLTLLRNITVLFSSPKILLEQLFSKSSLRIPAFLGLMPLIYHALLCTMNRVPMFSNEFRNVTAGAASGLAMLAFPNVSIAMYFMWKAIEVIYYNLAKQGKIQPLPYGDLLLYTVSTGYVLWQIIIEPQAIRKGYLKFLLGLTGNRMALLNRHLYEHFGYQSKLLFPYQPVLDPKYVTVNPMLYQPIPPP